MIIQRAGLKIYAALWLAILVTWTASAAPVVTIEPDVSVVGSCLAFGAAPGGLGGAPGFGPTSPYMGFIYKDIPAFDLSPGDILAFDLGAVNDFDVAIDIDMAATTVNGGTDKVADPFTKVVSNTYNPLKARGDIVNGNFDLRFVVDSAFSFAGGGLIIRFSNGSAAYRVDSQSCDQVGVVALSTDASGNFVQAFWGDTDGDSPWSPQPPIALQQEIIGGFQIIEGPTVLLAGDNFDQADTLITGIQVGETITYRLRAQNPGLVDATGVTVTATLDNLVTFVQSSTNPVAAAVYAAGPPATIVWSVGSLAAGAVATLDVDLDVPFAASTQTILSTAEVTASDAPHKIGLIDQTGVAASWLFDVSGAMFDQSGAPITSIQAGEPFVYRVTANNPSPVAGNGAEVTVTFPENILFQQASAVPTAATVFDAGPPETVVWTVGNMGVGATATLDIDVLAPFSASGKTVGSGAIVTAPAQGQGTVTEIAVDPAMVISSRMLDEAGAPITTASTGSTIRYEVVMRNNSQADATGVEVTATLSEHLDFQQALAGATSNATFNAGPPGTVVWNIDNQAAGSEMVLAIDLGVAFTANGQSLTNQALVTGSDAPTMLGDATTADITIIDLAQNLLEKNSGSCFIATAAYGSYLEPEVMVLRQFRDNYLLTNKPGRAFVAWYYRNSPDLAAQIAGNEAARGVIRLLLTPIVYILKYPLGAFFAFISLGLFLRLSNGSMRMAR